MQAHRDFHYADELLIEPGAPCEAEVIYRDGDARLRVGEMDYAVVIVPPSLTWTAHSVRLLHEFAAAGGAVSGPSVSMWMCFVAVGIGVGVALLKARQQRDQQSG